jgi:molybdopterin synthase catalytic subunit
MRVTVLLYAALRQRAGRERLVLDGLSAPLDVAALKRELEQRAPELGRLASVRGVLGTSYVPDDTPLADGAELSLLPPVSGGARDDDAALERGLFELSAEPLETGLTLARVAHPSCGAIASFVGVTRDNHRDRAVLRLDYEAFAAMARDEMARIYAECNAAYGPPAARDADARARRVLRMLTQHRTGCVSVGEPSVVIAVASPHRDAAFRACRFLIDELKARVPLWKKEVYADGEHWIGDRS